MTHRALNPKQFRFTRADPDAPTKPGDEPGIAQDYHMLTYAPKGEEHPGSFTEAAAGLAHGGAIEWHRITGVLGGIAVHPEDRRQGIGTALWKQAHEMAKKKHVVKPRHSPDRSDSGDAWARKVGGKLPKRWEYPSWD